MKFRLNEMSLEDFKLKCFKSKRSIGQSFKKREVAPDLPFFDSVYVVDSMTR